MDDTTDISVKKQCAFTVINYDYEISVPKTQFFNLVEFYHNGRQAASTAFLLQEFKLSLNGVQTIAQSVLDFISNRNGISIMTFNCQSLNSHKYDLQDSVTRQTNVLLLTETCMTHDNLIEIPNFNCIVQFKRDTVPKGGVAIYQNNSEY
ncbi:unnamed protein product [Psylliodes chrysocephalus]|uniref:Uncharacterized protein n=1 Tax=Psylliodes chrysocephalus TaxID=3402493 RepID=A0A9P0GEE7_9CUCU|nr:unnamed protein product [Psylliodes chrysocephala]